MDVSFITSIFDAIIYYLKLDLYDKHSLQIN